ncbi:MAG: hypothetical protein ACR2FS_03350 [Phormidesmis sp.]
MQPQVQVLDEPSAQLDPRSRRQLIELLDSLVLSNPAFLDQHALESPQLQRRSIKADTL